MLKSLTVGSDYDMKFEPITVNRVPHEWGRLLSYIRPSIIKSGTFDEGGLMRDLLRGSAEAVYASGSGIEAAFVTQITKEPEGLRCTINYAGGTVDAQPKAFIRVLQWGMGKLEAFARQAQCAEMRVSGRDWSRVLTDYERVDGGLPNELRKVL